MLTVSVDINSSDSFMSYISKKKFLLKLKKKLETAKAVSFIQKEEKILIIMEMHEMIKRLHFNSKV